MTETLPGYPNCRYQMPFCTSFRRHGSPQLETESSFYTELTAVATDPIMRTL